MERRNRGLLTRGSNFARSRTGAVMKNVVLAGSVKGLSLLVSLATMPALMRFFDDKVLLGLWFTAISVVNWILSLDFGIGNGLRHTMVHALGNKDRVTARSEISGTYAASIIIAVLVLLGGGVAIGLLDWARILNVGADHLSAGSVQVVVGILFLAVVLQSILRVVSFALYALQRSAVNNVLSLATSTLILVVVLVSPPAVDDTDIFRLCVAYGAAANLPLAVATIAVFRGPLRGLGPTPRLMNPASIRHALRSGWVFFYNQIAFTLILGTSPFLISSLLGPASAADYQVYYTLFTIAGTVMMLALTPLWSAVTLALAEGDVPWILRGLARMEIAVLVLVAFELLLVIAAPTLFRLWLGEHAPQGSWLQGIPLAIFGSIFVWHGVLATFAAGLAKLRLQAISYTIGVVVKVGGAVLLGTYWKDWGIMPLLDSVVLGVYCVLEHRSIRRKLQRS